MSHLSDPPIFSSTCMHTYICLSSRRFLTGGVVRVFLSGRLCPGWFLSVPFLSECIHYNRKLNITFNFKLNMYENNLIRIVTKSSYNSHTAQMFHTHSILNY